MGSANTAAEPASIEKTARETVKARIWISPKSGFFDLVVLDGTGVLSKYIAHQ
jgi:hypothetical protein